jgi:hypothetical protein
VNQEQRNEIRNRMLEMNKNSTHYKDCSKYHLTCRIIRAIDDYEQEVEDAYDYLINSGVHK